jgi:diguanylate cyclase (GGDEF)-like protein/PAS domain S-box-containing protein
MTAKLARAKPVEWLLTFALVALLAWGAKAFTRADSLVSTIWLANGLLLGMVLTADRSRRPGLLFAGVFGNLLGGYASGEAILTFLPLAVINVFEVWVASARQRPVAEAEDLTNPTTFRRFLGFAVLLAPLASTLVQTGVALVAGLRPQLGITLDWLISHALGMATFTPVTMALRRDDIAALLRRDRIGEMLLTLLLVAGVAVGVFVQSTFPLLFLVFPAMLLMAMRGGFGGTAIAVVVVVVIAVSFTVAGHGPLAMIPGVPRGQYFLVLQVFIASLLLTMFPVVVVLAERRRVHEAERDAALRLRLLAEHSTDVIVLTDVTGRRLYVSPGVTDVFGFTPEQFMALTYRDLIHPEDRDRVVQELQERAETRNRATVTYRAQRADGTEIWVEALVCTFQDEDFQRLAESLRRGGTVSDDLDTREGRVVTLRDVTRRRRIEEALAQANSELASLVWKDALTGLANRRRFDEAMREEWERCERAGLPLTVIMIDVDFFKAFNDQFGHQHGDRRLVDVARAITSALYRPRDVAVRYGGEEFAVVLPATGVDEAGLVAERIRDNVMRLDPGEHGLLPVTVSLGVAGAVPQARGHPVDIVKAADDALYTSKREGRNRTTLLQVNWPGGRHETGEITRLSVTGT